MDNAKSTVMFRSNLYPLSKKCIKDDYKFLSQIHDVFAVEELHKKIEHQGFSGYGMSSLQEQEYKVAAVHCAYADKDEYPWGTKLDKKNNPVVMCLCENIDCKYIRECRKGITEKELKRIETKRKNRFSSRSQSENIWEESLAKLDNKKEKNEELTFKDEIKKEDPIEQKLEKNIFKSDVSEKNEEKLEVDFITSEQTDEIENKSKNKVNDESDLSDKNKETADDSVFENFRALIGTPAFDLLPKELQEKINHAFKLDSTTAQTKNETVDVEEKSNIEDYILYNDHKFNIVNQRDIIEHDFNSNILVNAGPGTGKTYTLISRIIYLLEHGMNPENMLILCFSKNAVSVVKERLRNAEKLEKISSNWRNLEVRTFDSFASKLIYNVQEQTGDEFLPKEYKISSEGYDERIKRATKILQDIPAVLNNCEYLMVDEIQDLVACRADFVLQIIHSIPNDSGILALGDTCQSIYGYQLDFYEEKNGIRPISSEEFYKKLIDSDRDFLRLSITKNYRTDDYISEKLSPYRNALLNGKKDKCSTEMQGIKSFIEEWNENEDSLREVKEPTAILTRKNVHAMMMSSRLSKYDISHVYKDASDGKKLSSWISRFFHGYSEEYIDENTFKKRFNQVFGPDVSNYFSDEIWRVFSKVANSTNLNIIKIEDILRNLVIEDSEVVLFKEIDEVEEPLITVSTVHRAKGSEYDKVILSDDLFSIDEEYSDLEEHRVKYVALTRTKKHLYKSRLKKNMLYISSSKKSGRSYKKNFKGKYPSHVAITNKDFNNDSFALNEISQNYIMNNLKIGDELFLEKCQDSKIYAIKHVEYPDVTLGYTNSSFSSSINDILKEIFKTYSPIKLKYFPEKIKGLFVTELNTFVSPVKNELKGAKKFGEMYIWTGFSAAGFAEISSSKY